VKQACDEAIELHDKALRILSEHEEVLVSAAELREAGVGPRGRRPSTPSDDGHELDELVEISAEMLVSDAEILSEYHQTIGGLTDEKKLQRSRAVRVKEEPHSHSWSPKPKISERSAVASTSPRIPRADPSLRESHRMSVVGGTASVPNPGQDMFDVDLQQRDVFVFSHIGHRWGLARKSVKEHYGMDTKIGRALHALRTERAEQPEAAESGEEEEEDDDDAYIAPSIRLLKSKAFSAQILPEIEEFQREREDGEDSAAIDKGQHWDHDQGSRGSIDAYLATKSKLELREGARGEHARSGASSEGGGGGVSPRESREVE
jgi:hypothetical protein